MSEDNSINIEKIAKKILQDPIMIQKLSDRVLELLREDMRVLKERCQGYGNRF
jgi:dephospho-CoA kinase